MARRRDIVAATYPAIASSVPQVRAVVTAAAVDAGASPDQIDAIRLAATEAATNVVLHAYDIDTGSIHVNVTTAGDMLQIVIGDDGCGIRPRPTAPAWERAWRSSRAHAMSSRSAVAAAAADACRCASA